MDKETEGKDENNTAKHCQGDNRRKAREKKPPSQPGTYLKTPGLCQKVSLAVIRTMLLLLGGTVDRMAIASVRLLLWFATVHYPLAMKVIKKEKKSQALTELMRRAGIVFTLAIFSFH